MRRRSSATKKSRVSAPARAKEEERRRRERERERLCSAALKKPPCRKHGQGGKNAKKCTNKNALLGRIPGAETAGSWVKNKKNTRTKNQPPLTEERAGGKTKNKWGTKIKPAQN
jgi:hypothetical protein